jgi:hypothetical protein
LAEPDHAGPIWGENHQARRYFFAWFATHLSEAGEHDAVAALLLEPQWMQNKLDALEDPLSLLEDYRKLGRGQAHIRIAKVLQLIMFVLRKGPRQLIPQLLGRLSAAHHTDLRAFLEKARTLALPPTLIPLRATLSGTSTSEVMRISVGAPLHALALVDDQTIASLSVSGSIRLWNMQTGVSVASSIPTQSRVSALAAKKYGVLLVAADDAIYMWSTAEGRVVRRVQVTCKHRSGQTIHLLFPLGDNRILYATQTSVGVWGLNRNQIKTILIPGAERVTCAVELERGATALGTNRGKIYFIDLGLRVERSSMRLVRMTNFVGPMSYPAWHIAEKTCSSAEFRENG